MIATRKMLEDLKELLEKNKLAEHSVLSHPLLIDNKGIPMILVIQFHLLTDAPGQETISRPQNFLLCSLEGKFRSAQKIEDSIYGDRFPANKSYQFRPKRLPDSTYDEMYLYFDKARQAIMESPDTDLYRNFYDRYFIAICNSVARDTKQLYLLFSRPPKAKNAVQAPQAQAASEPEKPAQEAGNAGQKPVAGNARKGQQNQGQAPVTEKPDAGASAKQQSAQPQRQEQKTKQPAEKRPAAQEKKAQPPAEQKPVEESIPVELMETKAVTPPQKQEKVKEPEKPAKKEEKKETEKLVWSPKLNLSTMPEMTFRMHEQIAEHIEFLDNKVPGQLRLSYPLYCFDRDRKYKGGMFQELLYRFSSDELPKAHMRIDPKNSIYARCANAKNGCFFASCPFIIASYIKYLKENDPEELKRQREAYKKKKNVIDRKYLKALPYPVVHPEKADGEEILAGGWMINSGRIEFSCDEALFVTWREHDEEPPKIFKILPKDLQKADGPFCDETGNPLPDDVYYAILAYDDMTREEKGEEKGEAPKEAPMENQKKKTAPAKDPLTDYMAAGSLMHRALTDPSVKTIYGTFITPFPVTEQDSFVKLVMSALKKKGFTEAEFIKGSSNSVPRAGKICFVNLNGNTEFKADYFTAKAAVILCGRPQEIAQVMLNPGAKALYGNCIAARPDAEYDALYQAVLRLLPEHLSKTVTSRDAFVRWLNSNPLPRTEENDLAEYITWLCVIQDRIVFS